MSKYVIGVDYGTLSGRAVLVEADGGRVVASSEYLYPHGVMDEILPWGEKLPAGWALQHPQDYLDVLTNTLPEIIRGIDPAEIGAIGLDCTSATVLPVDAKGCPLCFSEEFCRDPYSYIFMWKHHGAQEQAKRMNKAAVGSGILDNYGGIVNSEWMLPKLLQICEEAPGTYAAMAHYVEVVDWLLWQLSGVQSRSAGCLGYKALFTGEFPSKGYFASLHPGFENVAAEKLSGPVAQLGTAVGRLCPEWAEKLGLSEDTVLAAGNIDAHVCLPAVGIDGPGKLLAIIGTSTCHIVMSEKMLPVEGMSGVVMGGVLPGLAAYEAGQSCVGDSFAWFEKNAMAGQIKAEAEQRGLSPQEYLTELARKLKAGESGLLALDWFNGNRSVLSDSELTGLILGMDLHTRPQEIYRALIESTAYGAKVIVERYRESGVEVNEFWASGGVSQKNSLAMQIYADVLDMPVRVTDAREGPALGSAIYAAAAAGLWPSLRAAIAHMGGKAGKIYYPDGENVKVYSKLYAEYKKLHDYFGRGEDSVMKTLLRIKNSQCG